MNKPLFRKKLKEKKMKQGEVAKSVGITEQSFSNKLNERYGREFTLGEVMKIKTLLNLTKDELILIFFDDFVS